MLMAKAHLDYVGGEGTVELCCWRRNTWTMLVVKAHLECVGGEGIL